MITANPIQGLTVLSRRCTKACHRYVTNFAQNTLKICFGTKLQTNGKNGKELYETVEKKDR